MNKDKGLVLRETKATHIIGDHRKRQRVWTNNAILRIKSTGGTDLQQNLYREEHFSLNKDNQL